MAKNLTQLTERTATAETDLMHVNSGGTDYKETKANFTKDLSKYKNFATNSLLTSQIDALGSGVYSGVISAAGHQSETDVPQNAAFYVNAVVGSTGAYAIINLETASTTVRRWYKSKVSGTWDSSWTELPTQGALYKVFGNTSLLTTQVENLPAGNYFGYISSYGHQSETGVPVNYSFYVKAEKISSGYAYIELWSTKDAEGSGYASGGHYIATEDNGTWSGWTKTPTRSEIDSIFKRIVFFNFNLTSGGTAKHSLADHVPYGNQSGVVFLQPRGFTVNNISKIYMFRFNQAKTACYFTDVTPGVTSSLSARLDSDGNFYNTSTEHSATYDCALFLLYY